jgi:menaquinone-dependent protoporphyrinogen oxidase
MKILIAYASTEGQTRKIARFCADHLADAGHAVELMRAEDAEGLELGRYNAAILAGSVHIGHYQEALVRFAREAAADLATMPTLFLSVSLAAAGKDAEDWKGLDDCVERFRIATAWKPGRVEHVAGAFRFTEYDFFRAWAMRWIAAQKGQKVNPQEDKEYTDWDALARLMDDWAGRAAHAA